MAENKQKICDLLIPVLRETRGLYNVLSLEYIEKSGLVYAKCASGGSKVADVDGDSGVAMIQDILEQIT